MSTTTETAPAKRHRWPKHQEGECRNGDRCLDCDIGLDEAKRGGRPCKRDALITTGTALSDLVPGDDHAELVDEAWRRINICGTKVVSVWRDLTAAGHHGYAARLADALNEDLHAAHDALAHLLTSFQDQTFDGQDPLWRIKFVAVARALAALDDAEIVSAVRQATQEGQAPQVSAQ